MKYDAYGITLETPFQCPELPVSERETDVVVRWGTVQAATRTWQDHGVCYKAAPGAYLLSVPGLADFLVEEGGKVTIAQAGNAEEDRMRLHFYHEVMGALLWQRGTLLLKGCVLERAGRGIAIIGPTPSGKTMAATGLMQRGWRVVSDGICCITCEDKPQALPGYPHLILWKMSLKLMGMDAKALKPVRGQMLRYYLPLDSAFCNFPVIVDTIYSIAPSKRPGFEISEAKGIRKLNLLLDQRYHPELPVPLGVAGSSAQIAVELAKQARVKVLSYDDSFLPFEEYIGLLCRELDRELA